MVGLFHGMGFKGKLAKARCVQVRGGSSQRCFLGREITVSRKGDIFWRGPPRVIFVYYSHYVFLVHMKRDNSEVHRQGPPRAFYMYYSLCVFSCSCET